MNEKVGKTNGLISVQRRLPMLVSLAIQSADLHMGFTLVLQELEPQRRLRRIVEVLAYLILLKVLETLLQHHGAVV